MTDLQNLSKELINEINCLVKRLAIITKKGVITCVNTDKGVISFVKIEVIE